MDTFREPTLEEAKMLALQFMGQNLGEIKELDKNIIGKTNTLKGNTLNVQNILNSIPVQQQAPVLQAQQQAPRSQQPQINIPSAVSQFSVWVKLITVAHIVGTIAMNQDSEEP